jgi:hypothetical protein
VREAAAGPRPVGFVSRLTKFDFADAAVESRRSGLHRYRQAHRVVGTPGGDTIAVGGMPSLLAEVLAGIGQVVEPGAVCCDGALLVVVLRQGEVCCGLGVSWGCGRWWCCGGVVAE